MDEIALDIAHNPDKYSYQEWLLAYEYFEGTRFRQVLVDKIVQWRSEQEW